MKKQIKLYTEEYDFSPPWEENIPLVLIHGLGAHTEMWFPQVPDFSKHFPVILVDLPGCGKSPDTNEKITIEEITTHLDFTLTSMNIQKVNVLGISFGGFVALEYCTRFPEKCENVIFASTPYGFSDELMPQLFEVLKLYKSMEVRKIAETRIDKAFGELATQEMKQFLIDHISKTNHSVYVRMAEAPLHYDAKNKFKEVNKKSLIICGEMDYLATVSDGEKINNIIPDSEFVVLKKTGHASSLENPKDFNKAVIEFIKANN